jgi:hypothetical protein
MTSRTSIRRLAVTISMAALALPALVAESRAQQPSDLPFAPGEKLEYTGRVHAGVSVRGTFRVDGPNEYRGTTVWTLHSDVEGKVGFVKASNRAASWLDPLHMSALRYTSRERHLLSRTEDDVSIFPGEKRWSAEGGLEGPLVSEAPLDELSFLYFLRTLPLADEAELTLSRHFDAARNPTIVRVVGREDIDVGAGRFRAVVVEMRVRDARRYKGEGVIRIHLSDDNCRLILRLESNVPDAGKATLSLASYDGLRSACSAKLD